MLATTRESFVVKALFVLLLSNPSWTHAQVVPPKTPEESIASLQRANRDASLFIPQTSLDPLIDPKGGGACASAAAINALQVMRCMAGMPPLDNPHRIVLAAFAHDQNLLRGRVSNSQFADLFRFYEQYLHNSSLKIMTESAFNSTYTMNGALWPKEGPDLSIRPGQLRILSYTVTDPEGTVYGRHFVLLLRSRKNVLTVADSNSIDRKHLKFVLEYRPTPSGDRLFLLAPPEHSGRKLIFELNTVFTLTLEKTNSTSTKGASVDEVKQQIDATYRKLKGTKDVISPLAW